MDQYENRRGARIIAAVDCVFAVISVICIVIMFGAAVYISVDDNARSAISQHLNTITPGLALEHVLIACWIIVVVVAIEVAIATVAAFKLWNATEIGVNPAEALPKAKFWRVVTIVFTVLGGIYYAITVQILALIILIIIKGIFLYGVGKYIGELNTAKDAQERGVQYQGNTVVAPAYGFQPPSHEKV